MAMHVVGSRCPVCKRRGLVLGAFSPLTGSSPYRFLPDTLSFRPMGWRFQHLECLRAACPRCGIILVALTPEALRDLRAALRKERESEVVVYHASSTRRKPGKAT